MPGLFDLQNLVVVLVRPRNPLNIGAAARAMSNFGVSHLRLVNPFNIAFRDARSAVGASYVLKQADEYKTVAEAVADCALVVGTTAVRNRTLQHPLRALGSQSGEEIRAQLASGQVAILFGSEKIGLTNDDFSHCHWLLNIATQEQHISMNLGQSVAVCLYELARSAQTIPAAVAGEPATAQQTEQISEVMLEALAISGYVKPGTDALMEKKVRRLLLRLKLEKIDAKVFLGMVRQMLWKLHH